MPPPPIFMLTYGLTRSVAPTTEPISVAECRKQLEIADGNTDHDAHLSDLIQGAREWFEASTSRQLVSATWVLTLDNWPCGLDPILLPKAPVVSVTTIKYQDANDAEITWASTNYVLQKDREPAKILLARDKVWPTLYGESGDIVITFTAGYSSVPFEIRNLLKRVVADWFLNRTGEGEVSKQIQSQVDTVWRFDDFMRFAR